MKKFHIFWSLAIMVLFTNSLSAQVVYKQGTPYSFENTTRTVVPTEVMPEIDLDRLLKEDELDVKGTQAPRFGFLHEVNYNLENAGIWELLPNGDRLWRLHILAPDALTININYSKYNLPYGGELFIYSESEKPTVLGPFTNDNEKINGRFANGFTRGDACTIEYYEPKEAKGKGEIEIDGIVHGYRSIPNPQAAFDRAFQSSGNCNNDVECAIGNAWRDQIKSVAMLLTAGGTRFCSGALINNTGNDCKPYFLGANHCFGSPAGTVLNDVFMFNYHSPTPACPGTPTTDGPINQTVQGGVVVSRAVDSDFFLIELDDNPLDFYDVYYSGWNRANSGVTNMVGIHHPAGDVKKFSVDDDPPVNGNFGGSPFGTHWEVQAWDNGTTEGGSSGSPLFDQNQRIIGQLHGGTASCFSPNSPDQYGKIWYSWDQNGTAPTIQLAPWLDPLGTGAMFMDGNDCSIPIPPTANFSPADNSNLAFCNAGSIAFQDQSAGNPTSWNWTFNGAGVSPTTSTAQNPTVSVSSSGTLTATLTVSNSLGNDTQTHTYNVVISPCVTNSFCDVPNVAIPDNNPTGASSTFSVGPSGTIVDVDIAIDITHTWVGDLDIEVSHNGTTVVILNTSGCSNSNINAVFDDEATSAVGCATNPAITGIVIPAQALSAFDGLDQAGNWTITVTDNAGQDTGTLNEWCLEISTTSGGVTCYSMLDNTNGLNTVETGVADYESSDWISTSSPTVLQAGSSVDYDAVDLVQLNSGFEVQLNAVFHAFIDGCNNGAGGANLDKDETDSSDNK